MCASTMVSRAIVHRGILQSCLISQVPPTPLLMDSQTTTYVLRYARALKESAWMQNRCEFVQDAVGSGVSDPQHIPGLDNPANSDTKYEPEKLWKRDMLFRAGYLEEPFERLSLVTKRNKEKSGV